ncbi:hypothetical protein AQV86_00190 [Nanohaloarchaea archaeon SG9]|nr:hypothetical protein AQV86_00190 [Nanohaloarchaea archaeon SG9]
MKKFYKKLNLYFSQLTLFLAFYIRPVQVSCTRDFLLTFSKSFPDVVSVVQGLSEGVEKGG